jgi:hypothetical protein
MVLMASLMGLSKIRNYADSGLKHCNVRPALLTLRLV